MKILNLGTVITGYFPGYHEQISKAENWKQPKSGQASVTLLTPTPTASSCPAGMQYYGNWNQITVMLGGCVSHFIPRQGLIAQKPSKNDFIL